MLCRAREAGGDSAQVLHELGRVTAGMGRIATAIVYLERACELAPDDLAIRRTLADLGRKPRATVKLKERAAQSQRDRNRAGDRQPDSRWMARTYVDALHGLCGPFLCRPRPERYNRPL